jgi:hypothetical protein
MKATFWTAAAAAALSLAACGDGTGPRVPTAVEVVPQALALETGDMGEVQAVVVDQAGRPYTMPPPGYQIIWSSSAPLVADVQNGLVHALRPGQATITARAGDLDPAPIQVAVGPRPVSGQMAFAYDGFQTGTFAVDATFRLDQLDGGGDRALSWLTDEEDASGAMVKYQNFFARRVRSGAMGSGSMASIWFWTVGEITATGAWVIDGGYFIPDYSLFDFSGGAVYTGSGTMNITMVGDRRLVGTFAMELVEVDDQYQPTGEILDITDGSMSIPVLIPEVEGSVVAETMPGALELLERLRSLPETLPRR